MEMQNLQTDILHFDRKKNKRVSLKDCTILSNFFFDKNDFFIIKKSGYYFVCISVKSELVLVWYKKEIENGEKLLTGEVAQIFRKQYIKNNINKEKIDFFIQDPLSYEKKYKKP